MNPYFFRVITTIGFVIMFSGFVFAQNSITPTKDSLYNKRARSVYAELLGPGVLYSLNYDARFLKKQDGLGMRIGISYAENENDCNNCGIVNTDTFFSIPIQLNYLMGKDNKFFEIGVGLTYFNYSGDGLIILDDAKTNVNKVFGTMTFGYRYQPVNGGLTYRYSINPFFDIKNFKPWWFGFSIGYSFHK